MKMKSLLLALSAGVLLFASSCKDEVLLDNGLGDEKASLRVKLVGEGLTTRATEATEAEMAIHNYSIYVFYTNGSLEAMATDVASISGLTVGNKKIAVIANAPSGFVPSSVTSLSGFESAAFELTSQYPRSLAGGLIMSGVEDKTLITGENGIEIKVERLVAKIKLGNVTISPSVGHDPAKFELIAVHMMKVKSEAKLGSPNVLDGVGLYGGVDGDVAGVTVESVYKDYLTEAAVEGANTSYFYVFPNTGGDDATLMTIEGTYDGETAYFPFVINDQIINGDDGSGNYIKRNTLHTVSVTLKKLGGGVDNPETIVDPAAIDVTITPEDWVIVPGQGVEW